MAQDWKVCIWGVRGSMPAASREFLEFGGNTSCVSVDCGEELVVFDAGSGLTALGGCLAGYRKPIRVFISHVHIDHLLGLFTFQPFFDPGAEVHLYGEARDGVPFRRQLEALVGPPYWPIPFSRFRAGITVHETGPDQCIDLPGGRVMRTMRSNHPNGCLLYRLESEGHSVVYSLDCELTQALRPRLVEFCRDAGVLVWDANFTNRDLARHTGWGHSSWEQGTELRREAGVKLLLLAHYSQSYTDRFLEEQERLAAQPGVRFARETMEVMV